MNKYMKVVLTCIVIALIGGFVAWRTHAAAQVKPPVVGVVADLTSSHNVDRVHACLTIAGIVEQAIQQSSGQIGAQLHVVALGDSSRGGEPVVLSNASPIPMRTALSTGEDTLRKQRHAYIQTLYDNCIHAAVPEYSAVYLGLERMLETLHERHCGKLSSCILIVDTDGDDNVEAALKQRLQGTSVHRAMPILPLDNTGIEVHFCGLAQANVPVAQRSDSAGRRNAFRDHQAPSHVADVWRSIFVDPGNVSFAPFCAQPSNPTAYTQPVLAAASR